MLLKVPKPESITSFPSFYANKELSEKDSEITEKQKLKMKEIAQV